MKRLIVWFMALTVTTGAFAQFSVQGQLHTHFHARFEGGDDGHASGNFADVSPAWNFGFLTSQTWFQVSATGQNVNGHLRFRANGSWRGHIFGNWGNTEFGLGFLELPWQQSSPISFDGDGNSGIGSGASSVNPYLLMRFTVAPGTRVYVGITEGGAIMGGHSSQFGNNINTGGSMFGGNTSSGSAPEHWSVPFPGFFFGLDMIESGVFSVGAAFAGQATTSNRVGTNDVLAFMGTVHGRLFNVGPFSRIGLNVVLYQNPEMGFFVVGNSGHFAHVASSGRRVDGHNNDLTAMEAMVDFILPVPFGTVGFAYGVLMNFDANSDAIAMQTALQATVPLGNGFNLIPGLRFRFDNDHAGNERRTTDLGMHVRFNW